jgi:hypothetical protein
MLLQNVEPGTGLCNGTTGTVIGFVYCTAAGNRPIHENSPNYTHAAAHEPQIPIVLMRVDPEFWDKGDHSYKVPQLDIPVAFDMERVIAVAAVRSFRPFTLKTRDGDKYIYRLQLPLIPAFALTVHKAQGLSKDYVLFVASGILFARALTYVAVSRCKTLEGLSIVGEQLSHRQFSTSAFGNSDSLIRIETRRLRKFQGNTIRRGLEAQSSHSHLPLYNRVTPIPYSIVEPEYDDVECEK